MFDPRGGVCVLACLGFIDDLMHGGKWEESTRLCRHQRSNVLWGILAALGIARKQLDTAEIALAELGEVAKVTSSSHNLDIPQCCILLACCCCCCCLGGVYPVYQVGSI